jgi:hypothetical protein
MKPPIKFKTTTPSLLTLVALGYFVLCPMAQAVVPAPDGGYAGGNTAEGHNALLSLAGGTYNTAVGLFSLESNITGNFNTGIGAGTLLANTGNQNTATGAGALLSNSIGAANTANGTFALFSNTSGSANTATGNAALFTNDDGIRNTANGVFALYHNVSGGGNTAIGYQALANNTANGNTAVGNDSLVNNSTGFENTATGAAALAGNTTGQDNTAMGSGALAANVTGNFNNAFGRNALVAHQNGDGNVAVGDSALANHATGTSNTAIGNSTLVNATTGDFNIALGVFAGQNITGNNNIDIGNGGFAGEDNTIRIGNVSHTKAFIAGIFGVTTGGAAVPVMIDATGQLGQFSSSRRFKKDIEPMDKASEGILALKPVTFHYKSDTKGIAQFGLIAEDVAEVNPDLVVRDNKGEIYSVRYEAVNAMLLNEFLKEHRRVHELEETVVQQQKGMEVLTAQLKEQAAQIQKVSAQIEAGKLVPQVVTNP